MKDGMLEVSTIAAEVQRSKRKKAAASQGRVIEYAEDSTKDEGSPELARVDTRQHHSHRTVAHVVLPTKLFVLVTSGYLLQYAEEGPSDRLPEKVLHLGKESAAFACDLVPGKHYVLQVAQAIDEDGVTLQNTGSIFSKLGIRTAASKRVASDLLLVMPSGQEMESWMSAIRREIVVLGGRQSLLTSPASPGPNVSEVLSRHLEAPKHHLQIKRNLDQVTSAGAPLPEQRSFASSLHEDIERIASNGDTDTIDGIEREADKLRVGSFDAGKEVVEDQREPALEHRTWQSADNGYTRDTGSVGQETTNVVIPNTSVTGDYLEYCNYDALRNHSSHMLRAVQAVEATFPSLRVRPSTARSADAVPPVELSVDKSPRVNKFVNTDYEVVSTATPTANDQWNRLAAPLPPIPATQEMYASVQVHALGSRLESPLPPLPITATSHRFSSLEPSLSAQTWPVTTSDGAMSGVTSELPTSADALYGRSSSSGRLREPAATPVAPQQKSTLLAYNVATSERDATSEKLHESSSTSRTYEPSAAPTRNFSAPKPSSAAPAASVSHRSTQASGILTPACEATEAPADDDGSRAGSENLLEVPPPSRVPAPAATVGQAITEGGTAVHRTHARTSSFQTRRISSFSMPLRIVPPPIDSPAVPFNLLKQAPLDDPKINSQVGHALTADKKRSDQEDTAPSQHSARSSRSDGHSKSSSASASPVESSSSISDNQPKTPAIHIRQPSTQMSERTLKRPPNIHINPSPAPFPFPLAHSTPSSSTSSPNRPPTVGAKILKTSKSTPNIPTLAPPSPPSAFQDLHFDTLSLTSADDDYSSSSLGTPEIDSFPVGAPAVPPRSPLRKAFPRKKGSGSLPDLDFGIPVAGLGPPAPPPSTPLPEPPTAAAEDMLPTPGYPRPDSGVDAFAGLGIGVVEERPPLPVVI